ncbi:MAG: HAD hydrolase-like protein [Pseudomonadota bacterium]
MTVKAVLFGSLSSLTNLADIERRAFNRTFEQYDIPVRWTRADYDRLLRSKGRFSGPMMAVSDLGGLDESTFYPDLELHLRDLIDEVRLTPNQWTRDALVAARRKGLKIALVTGAERQTVLRVLAALYQGRASCMFDLVTSSEMSAAPKPDPNLYEIALSTLGVGAGNALAIEPTQHGVLAAQAAGIRTGAFRSSTSDAEQLSHADFELGETLLKTIGRFLASKPSQGGAAA